MRRLKYYIVLFVVTLLCCCNKHDVTSSDDTDSVVEVLEDGRYLVSASLKCSAMSEVEVSSRSSSNPEDNIFDGWCVVFGVDKTLYPESKYPNDSDIPEGLGYGPDSPILYKTQITANTNGRFFMTFTQITEKCFMRIAVNLSNRENTTYESVVTQEMVDNNDANGTSYSAADIATFATFYYQSVGLDAIYSNITYNITPVVSGEDSDGYTTYSYITSSEDGVSVSTPNPNNLQSAFPMSSYGYVLEDGITEDNLVSVFQGNDIYMIRVFSKVDVNVNSGCGFEIAGVTLLNGANEALLRSNILTESGDIVEKIDVPGNLGGSVQFSEAGIVSASQSNPIYLYPNSGGNYTTTTGIVDQSTNPTYIIVRGQAEGYDEEGYYKIALKVQYPLSYNEDGSVATYSDLSYNILRNTYFKITLLGVDKPGYKTFNDAADYKNPANNISYNITINGDDNRNEFLVSKGTYYIELEGSRVYAKGYSGETMNASVKLSLRTPIDENQHPNVYIYAGSDYGASDKVSITSCEVTNNGLTTVLKDENNSGWIMIPASTSDSDVVINFSATGSGRIRVRSGDILKYIPVVYEDAQVSYLGGTLTVDDGSSSWSDFRYDDISYVTGDYNILSANGTIASNAGNYTTKEFSAQIYPSDGSGVTKLYVKQACDFKLTYDGDNSTVVDGASNAFVYQSTGNIYSVNGTKTEDTTLNDSDTKSYTISGDEVTSNWSDESFITGYTKSDSENGFSLKAGNIGTNQSTPYNYANYVAANRCISNSTVFTLKNGAGESKTYTFSVTQYALPYNSHDGDCDGGTADRYISGDATNRGTTTHICAFYNCSTADTDEFAWTTESYENSLFKYIENVFDIDQYSAKCGNGAYVYKVTVIDSSVSSPSEREGYCIITLENDVGESVAKKIFLHEYSRHISTNYGSSAFTDSDTAY